MKRCSLLLCLWTAVLCAPAFGQEENLPENKDAVKRPGVPEGKIEGPFDFASKIFPGTQRQYWIYVPQQYDGSKPVCVFVGQDGITLAKNWKLPAVMDNLIHEKAMPVTIGIFVSPGVVPAAHKDAQARFNRSFEYDGMGNRYARFLIEELLPEVGKKYKLSDDPNDRAIGGSSSGAVCAFTAAWERPDAFRRVLSGVGTYVGLRGGNEYPVLIRKTEPKPLRVFLQDGSGDLDIFAGSWFQANQAMERSLQWSGYEVNHDWKEGGHNSKHMAAISGDALRWLWKDHPKPIQTGEATQHRIKLLIPGETWQLVSEGHKFSEGGAVNAKGEVFFSDIPNNRIHKVGLDGTVSVFAEDTQGASGLDFGPDGKLYSAHGSSRQIGRFDDSGRFENVVSGIMGNDLVVLHNGQGYCTERSEKRLWWFNTKGEKKLLDEGIELPNGLTVSPDQTLLYVDDSAGRFIYGFQIQPDGTLAHKQEYGWLHTSDASTRSGADGMITDSDGNLYVATRFGVQVLDPSGRVHLILSWPHRRNPTNLVLGGPERNVLYVTMGDKVFRRKVATTGVSSSDAPSLPPQPAM